MKYNIERIKKNIKRGIIDLDTIRFMFLDDIQFTISYRKRNKAVWAISRAFQYGDLDSVIKQFKLKYYAEAIKTLQNQYSSIMEQLK